MTRWKTVSPIFIINSHPNLSLLNLRRLNFTSQRLKKFQEFIATWTKMCVLRRRKTRLCTHAHEENRFHEVIEFSIFRFLLAIFESIDVHRRPVGVLRLFSCVHFNQSSIFEWFFQVEAVDHIFFPHFCWFNDFPRALTCDVKDARRLTFLLRFVYSGNFIFIKTIFHLIYRVFFVVSLQYLRPMFQDRFPTRRGRDMHRCTVGSCRRNICRRRIVMCIRWEYIAQCCRIDIVIDIIFFHMFSSDQSAPHHHRQTSGRCRRASRHTFATRRWRRCGNWASI